MRLGKFNQTCSVSAMVQRTGMGFGAAVTLRSLLECDRTYPYRRSNCHPVSTAVALALAKQGSAKLASAAKRLEQVLAERLEKLRGTQELVTSVSGKGALWAIGLDHRPSSKKGCLVLRDEAAERAFEMGLYLAKTGARSLIVAPPLLISDADLDRGLHVLEEVLAEVG